MSVTQLEWQYTWVGGELVTMVDLGGSTETYTYDVPGQLAGVARTGSLPYTDTWTWDGGGNVASAMLDGVPQTWAYDALDRLSSRGATTYGSDTTGRITGRNDGDQLDLAWEGTRLAGASGVAFPTVDYTYDVDGLLVARTEDGIETRYLWDRSGDNPKLAATYDPVTSTVLQLFVYGHDQLLQVYDGADVYTAHTDRLGTLRGLTDDLGVLTDTWEYDAWGNEIDRVGTADVPLGFTGFLRDDATGMQYALARWYEPASGRFLSRDPIGGGLQAPLTLNRYVYGRGDPVHYMDPNGAFTLISMSTAIAITVILHTAIDLTFGLMALQRVMRIIYGQLGYEPLKWEGPSTNIGLSLPAMAKVTGKAYLGTAKNDLGSTTADVLFVGGGVNAGITLFKLPGGAGGASGGFSVKETFRSYNYGQQHLHPEWPLESRPNPFPLGSPSWYVESGTFKLSAPAGLGSCSGPSQTTIFTGIAMTAYKESMGGCSGPGGGVSSSPSFSLSLGSFGGGASSVQAPLTP